MKHKIVDKYSIAWFKLAECVARGEKERALGVFRLLSHSIADQTFAIQLQGDLFYSFNDIDVAIKKYEQAAYSYHKEGKILKAAVVLEHILTINAHLDHYREQLIDWYTAHGLINKKNEHVLFFFKTNLEKYIYDKSVQYLRTIDKTADAIKLIQEIVLKHLYKNDALASNDLFYKILDLLATETHLGLQQFLVSLESVNPPAHEKASVYLKNNVKS